MDCIDPTKERTKSRLYRTSCISRGNYYIKDLRILDRPLESIAIIDNSIVSFMSQIDNGIPIKSYCGETSDKELLLLLPFLKELSTSDDVRVNLRQKYFLSTLQAKVD